MIFLRRIWMISFWKRREISENFLYRIEGVLLYEKAGNCFSGHRISL